MRIRSFLCVAVLAAVAPVSYGQPGTLVNDLVTRAKDGMVQLSWTPIPNAASYTVLRRVPPSVPAVLASGYVTTAGVYVDSAVANGLTYCYTVRWAASGGAVSNDGTESCAVPAAASARDDAAPSILSAPVTTAAVGQLYTYAVRASDPNSGETLTFSLPTAPAGMTISPTGLVQWTPTQTGVHQAQVRVQDSKNHAALQTFQITVSATAGTVAINASRASGSAGTQFTFTAAATGFTPGTLTYTWNMGDGRTLTGNPVSASYSKAGLYAVQATVTAADGGSGTDNVAVTVFDASSQAPADFHLPAMIGDVNGDRFISLEDAHLVAKHAANLASLTAANIPAGDVDFDRLVTMNDARLLAQSVMQGSRVPSALDPATGAPGTFAHLSSPALLDPDGLFTIEVGNSPTAQTPLRLVLGYANFFVPFDTAGAGRFTTTPGPIEVRLKKNGLVVERFTFTLQAPAAPGGDAKGRLTALFTQLNTIFQNNVQSMQALLSSIDGLSDDERKIVLAILSSNQQEFDRALANLQQILSGADGDKIAEAFMKFADANGGASLASRALVDAANAQEFNACIAAARLRQGAGLTPRLSGDDTLAVLCTAKSWAASLNRGATAVSQTCDGVLAASLAALLLPPPLDAAGPAIFAGYTSVCVPLEGGITVVSTVNDLIEPLSSDWDLTATPSTPTPPAAARISAMGKVTGLASLCGIPANYGSDAFAEKVIEISVNALLKRKSGIKRALDLIEKLNQNWAETITGKVQGIIKSVIDVTGITRALGDFSQKLCSKLSVQLPLDLTGKLNGPEPAVGALSWSGGSANYVCPTIGSGASTIGFSAGFSTCDKPIVEKQVTVTCGAKSVIISMGDNGNAVDDIYEVRVDGTTVLTSSSPVRSASTVLLLSLGMHTVQMIGRAAPDGIGTYFIQIGATVVSGDPMSGTDLTPGVVKTWQVRVE